MNFKIKILLLSLILMLNACANYKIDKKSQTLEKKFYSSKGFVLIYEDAFYEQRVIDKKLNNDQIIAIHSSLKKNTTIKIINPENSTTVETKIFKNANYPKIFNLVISKKIASILELDIDNPYVEIYELKKNKTFVAKEGSMFEEEKQVAAKAPVDEVQMDNLSEIKRKEEKKIIKKNIYELIVGDFYYQDSAHKLMEELIKQTKTNIFSIRKINNNKYRLSAGPFENFNSLKTIYISLNNLGFEDLNIYKK